MANLYNSRDEGIFRYFEEFPLELLHDFDNVTGVSSRGDHVTDTTAVLVVVLQYGQDYHGPKEDVFRVDRASTDPVYAYLSNFLHPVLYYYDVLPTSKSAMH